MRRICAVLTVLALAAAVAACDSAKPAERETDAPGRDAQSAAVAWRKLPDAPSARTEVAAATSGGRIVVVGGYRADGATLSTVEVFDPAGAGTWRKGPDLPLAVNHAMAATVDDRLYVFGGYLGSGAPSAAAFTLDGDRWRSVADMPEPRAAGTAVALDGKVYVAAGIGPATGLAERMLVFDPAANTWSTAPGPPTRREHLGGAGFGGILYTVGGRTGAGNLPTLESFDPATGAWSELPDMPTPRGGMAATATCAGVVVAVGGENPGTFEEVEGFDIEKKAWSSYPPLPTPRHGLGVVTLNSTVYVLAGGPKPGMFVSAATESIDLGGC